MSNEQYQGNGLPNITSILSKNNLQNTNISNNNISSTSSNNVLKTSNLINEIPNIQPIINQQPLPKSNNLGASNNINQNNVIASNKSSDTTNNLYPIQTQINIQKTFEKNNNNNQTIDYATNINKANTSNFSNENSKSNSDVKILDTKDANNIFYNNPFDIGLTSNSINSNLENNNNIQTIIPNNLNNNTNELNNINNISLPNITNTKNNDINLDFSNKYNNSSSIVSVSEYLKYIIIFSIPIIGLIILLKKAFSRECQNDNIKNFAKAQLILLIIIFILGGIFTSLVSKIG